MTAPLAAIARPRARSGPQRSSGFITQHQAAPRAIGQLQRRQRMTLGDDRAQRRVVRAQQHVAAHGARVQSPTSTNSRAAGHAASAASRRAAIRASRRPHREARSSLPSSGRAPSSSRNTATSAPPARRAAQRLEDIRHRLAVASVAQTARPEVTGQQLRAIAVTEEAVEARLLLDRQLEADAHRPAQPTPLRRAPTSPPAPRAFLHLADERQARTGEHELAARKRGSFLLCESLAKAWPKLRDKEVTKALNP